MTSLNRFLRPKIYLGSNMTIINDTIDIGSSKLINLEDGTNSQDAITFSQLLNLKNFLNNSIQNTNVFLNLQKSRIDSILLDSGVFNNFKTVVDFINKLNQEEKIALANAILNFNQQLKDENLRATTMENNLNTTITNNNTDINNNLYKEIINRTNADNLLTNTQIKTVNLFPSPIIYVDSTIIPTFPPNDCIIDGWYVNNSVLGSYCNYYITPISNVTYSQLNYLSINTWIYNNKALPYLILNLNNNKKVIYKIKDNSVVNINSSNNIIPYQFYAKINKQDITALPIFGYRQIEMSQYLPNIFNGPNNNDIINSIAICSDPNSEIGSENWVVGNFCICLDTGVYESKFISSSLSVNNTNNLLNNEILRATTTENNIISSLNTQIIQEQNDYSYLNINLNTLKEEVTDEINRAKNSELVIIKNLANFMSKEETDIKNVTNSLTTETIQRINADTILQQDINSIKITLLSLLNALYGNGTYTTFPAIIPNNHR
jgi:hypothetical protein